MRGGGVVLVQSVECFGAIFCLLDDGLPFVKRVLNSASSRILHDSVLVLEGKQPKPQCVCLGVLACTGSWVLSQVAQRSLSVDPQSPCKRLARVVVGDFGGKGVCGICHRSSEGSVAASNAVVRAAAC